MASHEVGENSPLGGLAGDAACDRRWPSDGAAPGRFRRRLIFAGACTEARNTLDAAWREYVRSQRLSAGSLRRSRRAAAAVLPMAETVDLCPVNVDGRVVYAAAPGSPLSLPGSGSPFWCCWPWSRRCWARKTALDSVDSQLTYSK